MSLAARVARAEAGLSDGLMWIEAQYIAAKSGEEPLAVFEEARRIAQKYDYLFVSEADGMPDIAPILRTVAEGEGFEYEELAVEAKRILRRYRARQRRWAK